MKIGIDIDEVITETLNSLLKYINIKRGTNFVKEDINEYGLWNCGLHKSKEECILEFEEFQSSSDFDNIPLVEFVKESLIFLKKRYELVFITARPEKIREKTLIFLKNLLSDENFELIHAGGVYSGKTKAEICVEKNCVFMIEDNFNFANDCAKKGIKTFLFDKPWNKNIESSENLIKVRGWKELINYISGGGF